MKYLIPIFAILFLIMPIVVQAIADPCRGILADVGEGGYKLCQLLENVRRLLWYVGWFVALIVILFAGIMYMTSGGDQEKVTKAKKLLTYGIIGVVIMLASSFILGLIQQLLYPVSGV